MIKVAELLKKMSEIGAAASTPDVWVQLKAIALEFRASTLLVVGDEQSSEGSAPKPLYTEASRPEIPTAVQEAMADPELARVLGETGSLTLSEFPSAGPFRRLLEIAAEGGDAFVVPVGNGSTVLGLVVFAGPTIELTPFARALLFVAGYSALTHAFGLAVSPVQTKRAPGSLTDREAECLRWLSVGKSDSEISIILGISPRTVRFHIDNAKVKLGAATRIQAVAKALREAAIAA